MSSFNLPTPPTSGPNMEEDKFLEAMFARQTQQKELAKYNKKIAESDDNYLFRVVIQLNIKDVPVLQKIKDLKLEQITELILKDKKIFKNVIKQIDSINPGSQIGKILLTVTMDKGSLGQMANLLKIMVNKGMTASEYEEVSNLVEQKLKSINKTDDLSGLAKLHTAFEYLKNSIGYHYSQPEQSPLDHLAKVGDFWKINRIIENILETGTDEQKKQVNEWM